MDSGKTLDEVNIRVSICRGGETGAFAYCRASALPM